MIPPSIQPLHYNTHSDKPLVCHLGLQVLLIISLTVQNYDRKRPHQDLRESNNLFCVPTFFKHTLTEIEEFSRTVNAEL